MDRASAAERIAVALGPRRLVWVGFHGADAATLCSLPQFTHCYSSGSPLGDPRIDEFSIEEHFGQRQFHLSDWGMRIRQGAVMQRLEALCDTPTAIVPFVAVPVLDRIEESHPEARYLGISSERFERLNSKPYVEAGLRRFAPGHVQMIDWQALPDGPSRPAVVRSRLARGPIVLRADVSQAGMGHELIRDEAALAGSRLLAEEAVAVGPFIEDHIPLAVGACVFPDGQVTLHCPSVQLVGLRHAGGAPFRYCGNDFGAVKRLPPRLLENLEAVVRTVGAWLHEDGYVGVFGIDALVHDGRLFFVELNPRFQGSTWLVNRIEARLDMPDVVQDHLMAWLGLPARSSPPLHDLVAAQPARSQVLVFNRHEERVAICAGDLHAALPRGVRARLVPAEHVLVHPGDLLFALDFDRGVTTDGHSIDAEAAAIVERAERCIELRGRPLRPPRQTAVARSAGERAPAQPR